MTSSPRNLLLIGIAVSFLQSSGSTAELPPPDTYVIVELEDGKVTDAHLTKSTGDPKLDAATLERFRKWRFKPNKKVRRVKIPIRLAKDTK
jgi:hypothetical protein